MSALLTKVFSKAFKLETLNHEITQKCCRKITYLIQFEIVTLCKINHF